MFGMPDIFYGFLGLFIGSFLNVCIHRIPREESIVYPPSHCPECGMRLCARDLVPVLSYLALGRRCRECWSPISAKYPFVELLAGAAFWLAASQSENEVMLLKNFIFLSGMIVVIFTDLEHMIIPDAITLPLLGAGLVFAALPAVAEFAGMTLPAAVPGIKESALAAAAGFGGFYALAVFGELLLKTEAMGGGDIKLAAAMGAFLGWRLLFLGLFLAFLYGSVIGLALVAARGGRARQAIPFGPMMAAGGVTALFFAEPVLAWYAGLLDNLWSIT